MAEAGLWLFWLLCMTGVAGVFGWLCYSIGYSNGHMAGLAKGIDRGRHIPAPLHKV